MKCEECKESIDCVIYQNWLNTRDCSCPLTKDTPISDYPVTCN